MKTVVHLPYGYARTYNGSDRFVKAAPEFDVSVFNDNGDRVTDPYPHYVTMGPDMYRLLKETIPGIAARLGEDNVFEGKVDPRPRRPPEDQYAYYGYGTNPLTGLHNEGIGLIGFGKDPTPQGYGEDNAGHSNVVYVKKFNAPSANANESKSAVLTNILNDSLDFSPLFSNLYDFKDPEYDEKTDTEGRGPRPTNHWVPRWDKEKGGFMLNPETGKKMFMPVPYFQSLPIYNFRHPMWEKDPEAAWNMISDPKSAMDWKSWGKAPSFAKYNGARSATNSGKIRPMDYLLANMKFAQTPGYFAEAFPDKDKARYDYQELKARIKQAMAKNAIEQTLKDEKANALLKYGVMNEAGEMKNLRGSGGGKGEIRNRFRGVLNKMYKNPNFAKKLTDMGITPEDKIPMLDMMVSDPAKYGAYANDDAKALVILDAYGKSRGKNVGAFADAMKGPGE